MQTDERILEVYLGAIEEKLPVIFNRLRNSTVDPKALKDLINIMFQMNDICDDLLTAIPAPGTDATEEAA